MWKGYLTLSLSAARPKDFPGQEGAGFSGGGWVAQSLELWTNRTQHPVNSRWVYTLWVWVVHPGRLSRWSSVGGDDTHDFLCGAGDSFLVRKTQQESRALCQRRGRAGFYVFGWGRACGLLCFWVLKGRGLVLSTAMTTMTGVRHRLLLCFTVRGLISVSLPPFSSSLRTRIRPKANCVPQGEGCFL